MQTEFTPLMSLLGGAIIGAAAVLLMATSGRIAGVSGIVAKLLPPVGSKADMPAAGTFVAGLLLAFPLFQWFTGTEPQPAIATGLAMLALAGFLTGFGAALGNGCTSGHGVCGLSRLSARSLVATATFMLTAFTTVFILRHVLTGVA